MYEDHGEFVQPADPDAKIWRYMDFTKFVWMLEKRALHFARGDAFADKFEGAIPRANVPNKGSSNNFVDRFFTPLRKQVAINCWHINDYESAAMWKMYLGSDEGIAICSTVKRLRGSLASDPSISVFVGVVRYIDYERHSIPLANIFTPYLHKRTSFEYERELRALAVKSGVCGNDEKRFWTTEEFDDEGIAISIDLDELVEEVFVAPTTPIWFQDLIGDVLRRYGLDKPVTRSDLEASPLY